MGTLIDITSNANVINKRQASNLSPSQASNAKKGNGKNVPKARSPHFMSPTFSSSNQSATKISKERDKASPSSSSFAADQTSRSNWMVSAVRRVGLNRVGDGMPRSRKEGLLSKATALQDKVSVSILI